MQIRAKGILNDNMIGKRDIYVLSSRGVAQQKLKHDSESEGEAGVNGESGSQPILFKKEPIERLKLPPSPTMQASSGESSQLGNSVDPQR